jgi:HlyD family secretion protein
MANARQSRGSSILFWLSGIAVIGLLFFGIRALTRQVVEVRVVAATYQTLSSTVGTGGKVEPVDEFQAYAPFPGAIKQIYVSVGQKVAKGALLIKMDDADAQARLATARANLSNALNFQKSVQTGGNREEQNRFQSDIAAAQMEQQQAQTELDSRKALLARGATSPAEVAAAQQRLDAANLTLQSARQRATQRYNPEDATNAGVHVADAQAAVDSAMANLANVDIRTPIAGTVYNVPFQQFDFVKFGDDMVDVADLSRLKVTAYFDEPEIGKLAAGQPVKIVWDAKLDRAWHGHVTLAPTSIFAYGNRNVGVCIISVDDPTPDLIPNTNVTVTVTEMERTHVLSIPREALHTDGPRNFVYEIAKGKLVQKPVVAGMVNLTNAEIVSGLAPDEKVVLGPKSSLTELTNGLEVKQVE